MEKSSYWKNTVSIDNPNKARRIIAGLLDFVLQIIISCVLFAFIVQPVAETIPLYYQSKISCQTIMVDSGLYEKKDTEILKIYNCDYTNEELDGRLDSFYTKYDTPDAYISLKKEQINKAGSEDEKLFSIDSQTGNVMMIEDKKDSDSMTSWLRNSIDEALVDVLQVKQEWRDSYTNMIKGLLLLVVISYIFSSLIIYLFLPLILKGKTAGHKLMGLSVYSVKYDSISLRPWETIFRYVVFCFLNLIFGVFTLGIIPLASFLFAIYNHRQAYFHDLITKTRLVSTSEKEDEGLDSFAKKALHMEKDNYVV